MKCKDLGTPAQKATAAMNMPIGDAAKLVRINLPIAAARFLSSLYA
jgi:hypothetical protein